MSLNNIEEINYLTHHIKDNVQNIINPIGFKEFGFRLFCGTSSVGLSTDHDFNKYFEIALYEPAMKHYQKELANLEIEGGSLIRRVGEPEKDNTLLNALYNFNLWNSLGVYKFHSDFILGFYFIASTQDLRAAEVHFHNNTELDQTLNQVTDRLIKIFDTKKSLTANLLARALEANQPALKI